MKNTEKKSPLKLLIMGAIATSLIALFAHADETNPPKVVLIVGSANDYTIKAKYHPLLSHIYVTNDKAGFHTDIADGIVDGKFEMSGSVNGDARIGDQSVEGLVEGTLFDLFSALPVKMLGATKQTSDIPVIDDAAGTISFPVVQIPYSREHIFGTGAGQDYTIIYDADYEDQGICESTFGRVIRTWKHKNPNQADGQELNFDPPRRIVRFSCPFQARLEVRTPHDGVKHIDCIADHILKITPFESDDSLNSRKFKKIQSCIREGLEQIFGKR